MALSAGPISKFTETYWRSLVSPGPDRLPVPHEPTEEGSECKRCGQKKIYWERLPDFSLVKATTSLAGHTSKPSSASSRSNQREYPVASNPTRTRIPLTAAAMPK